MITCPVCGSISKDLEFCDRCNADLSAPGSPPLPSHCPFLPTGHFLSSDQQQQLIQPRSFLRVSAKNKNWRVHWMAKNHWPKWQPQVDQRKKFQSPPLPPIEVRETDEGIWIAVEAKEKPWRPWQATAGLDSLTHLGQLVQSIPPLVQMLKQLEDWGLIWLTFDPGEIEVEEDGQLWLTNQDLQVFSKGTCPENLGVRPNLVAPEIWKFRAAEIGPATHVYHLAIFSYCWLARLLPDGLPTVGLEAIGFNLPFLRIYAPDLPVGILQILERGLHPDPRQRLADPKIFLQEISQVYGECQARHHSARAIQWEIGSHSRTGKTKEKLGFNNEDHVLVKNYEKPPRALLAVADGISTCEVGSGALASFLTCLLLENSLDAKTHREQFFQSFPDLCIRTAQNLLSWALEKGYRDQLLSGRDLMGTTLLAGWLEERQITLGNIGDSRAYLIHGPTVEQLTVDGDVGSTLLAGGTPPETVREMGLPAKSLHVCIGGLLVYSEDGLAILEDGCVPTLSTWPLLPGDILVLCSDGLVEEGAFLDRESLGRIVQAHKDLPASDIARKLADAAENLQRLPSPLEPEGLGDNITCIVVKITEPRSAEGGQ